MKKVQRWKERYREKIDLREWENGKLKVNLGKWWIDCFLSFVAAGFILIELKTYDVE